MINARFVHLNCHQYNVAGNKSHSKKGCLLSVVTEMQQIGYPARSKSKTVCHSTQALLEHLLEPPGRCMALQANEQSSLNFSTQLFTL